MRTRMKGIELDGTERPLDNKHDRTNSTRPTLNAIHASAMLSRPDKADMAVVAHEWVVASEAWDLFLAEHPELGYPSGKWGFHNFLRRYRSALQGADAIRLARARFWIAHQSRFKAAAFECATGRAHGLTGAPIDTEDQV